MADQTSRHTEITLSTRTAPGGALSADVQDVDDEHEGVVSADARLRDAARAVAVLRRDREQHPGADLLADEPVVPAPDDHAHPDREGQRLAAVVRVVEDMAAPGLPEVVHLDLAPGVHHLSLIHISEP